MTTVLWGLLSLLWLLKTILVSYDSVAIGIIVPLIIDILVILFLVGGDHFRNTLNKGGIFKVLICVNIFLIFSTAIGVIQGYSLLTSVSTYIRLVTCQCIFIFGCLSYSIPRVRKWFFVVVFLSVFIHLIAGALGPVLALGAEEIDGVVRYSGLAGKINILANFALFFAVLFYVYYDSSKSNLTLLAFLLSVFVVFVTGTVKNAIILILFISYLSLVKSNRKIIIIPLFFIIIVPIGIYIFQHTSISARVSEFVETGISINIEQGEKVGNSFNWRLMHWRLLLSDWFNEHFWFGTGLGHYVVLDALTTQSGITFDPHNDWIKFLLEFGFLGFLFFIYFLWRLLQFTFYLSNKDPLSKGVFYSLCASLIAMLSANVVYSLPIFYYFWALLGFSYYKGLTNNEDNSN
ncbi:MULTISPECIES: O-antigen ligase family protein [Vibrio]|uniref:O-antigen ligase family protein n=1 Tax=Vibrio TaxID=662 RepID=UPI000D6433BF|nr:MULTISPECIES: O-antigen ligase family protein [Vibrio]MCS0430616.1 O-antigen ligase family protein [Vibrio diabolicus]MDF4879485.1 O-antigen ligase family protein [Vibrio parahaemolyticus]PWF73776.1 hypothetical protein CBX98_05195 [Vibrio sp. T9]